MPLEKQRKQEIMSQYSVHEKDTGSPEVHLLYFEKTTNLCYNVM